MYVKAHARSSNIACECKSASVRAQRVNYIWVRRWKGKKLNAQNYTCDLMLIIFIICARAHEAFWRISSRWSWCNDPPRRVRSLHILLVRRITEREREENMIICIYEYIQSQTSIILYKRKKTNWACARAIARTRQAKKILRSPSDKPENIPDTHTRRNVCGASRASVENRNYINARSKAPRAYTRNTLAASSAASQQRQSVWYIHSARATMWNPRIYSFFL